MESEGCRKFYYWIRKTYKSLLKNNKLCNLYREVLIKEGRIFDEFLQFFLT